MLLQPARCEQAFLSEVELMLLYMDQGLGVGDLTRPAAILDIICLYGYCDF
jgi:hypothetical protein